MRARAQARFITIPLSHYCEKARWALDLAAIEYREQAYLPLIHRWHTARAGGSTVPLLVTAEGVLEDSAQIVGYADAHSRGARLYPAAPAERQDALELERYFDRELGPHTRRWAYFHLLGCVSVLNRTVASGVPAAQRALAPWVMSLARPLIRRGYRVNADSAQRSLQRARAVFDAVDGRLADQRRYLVGDSLSVADLTFAALAAPLLLPPRYRGTLPSVQELPAAMAAECARLRATRAGQFALQMYERHRGALAEAPASAAV